MDATTYKKMATGQLTAEEIDALIAESEARRRPWWLRLLKALSTWSAFERRTFRRRDPRDDQRNIRGDWERVDRDLRKGLEAVITTPKSPAPQPPPSSPAASTARTRTRRSAG
jgi:hypothetical protein